MNQLNTIQTKAWLILEAKKFNGKIEYVYIIINADDYNTYDERLQ